MNKRTNKTSSNVDLCGLSLTGTVIDRMRRMVPRDNPSTEIVTYTIQDDHNRKFFVDDYAPDNYHEIESNVCIPVYVKTYRKKNGEPSYTLNTLKPDVERGERF